MKSNSLLLLEDDPGIRHSISTFLRRREYAVETVESCSEAERAIASARPDLALLDYELPDGNSLRLVPLLRDAGVPVIVLTGNGSIELAVRAIKEGAEQFLTKPIELETLAAVVERTLENQRNRQKQVASGQQREPDPFVGPSAAMRQLREEALRIAEADSPVLLLGETGSGKGVLARWLHRQGPRAKEAIVDLNCAGFSKDLLESELFGHERGAFTGALAPKQGLLEVAHRGTVFLDEIGDLDLQLQPRLLKVLEEKKFRRVGDVRDRHVDIRLVAATHHDLSEAVRARRFRDDLYYRISTFPLRIPPLRERADDVPELAARLLETIRPGRNRLQVSPAALAKLQSYEWPGNVRELRNVLERAALLAKRDVLEPADLRLEPAPAGAAAGTDQEASLESAERRHIEEILRRAGSVAAAAEQLGLPKSTLYYKMKKHGIQPPGV